MAGAIGLFIWLAFSNLFRSSDEIDVRQLEETVLYYKFDAAEKEFKKDDYNAANHNRLYAVNYSPSYTTVYVTGR